MYSTQLNTELTLGKHNITEWVREAIRGINQSDIDSALSRAELFLTKDREDLNAKARVEEILHYYPIEEAKQLLVNQLLETIILIKPTLVVRGGREVAMHGISPMQAVATQIGLALHHDQLDAVQTGIEILAEFQDMGIFTVTVTKEEDRSVNRGGHIEVHGDSAIVRPTLDIPVDLYKRINFTRYLPPMLTQPLPYQ